jgi:hypothetical protein
LLASTPKGEREKNGKSAQDLGDGREVKIRKEKD